MLGQIITVYRQVERFFGNMKFAVAIILVFAAALTYGTFMESYHGTEYANRLVYKSTPFMMLQCLMLLSIMAASLMRLPARPNLYGFHTIHVGLMTIFMGSFITYRAGVDGNMTLPPNTPTRQVTLSDDLLSIQFEGDNKEVTVDLPFVAGEKKLDLEYEGVKILRFLPFADEVTVWKEDKLADTNLAHSSEYRLANDNFGEDIVLSLHPDAGYPSTTTLGLLNVHYMPTKLAECFGSESPQGLLLWDARGGRCQVPKLEALKITKGASGQLIQVSLDGNELRFMPELSPMPLDKDLKVNDHIPYRIFGRHLFESKPHLFLFGQAAAWYDKSDQRWHAQQFEAGKAIALPWMGFGITLKKFSPYSYPSKEPRAVVPTQDNGQLITGGLKAVEVEVDGVRFWVKSDQGMSFTRPNGKLIFQLTKRALPLKFELTLDRFKMDTDPGTNNPASYESFLSLFKGDAGTEKHHVFMNNPLKYDSFTFYQASYFQTNEGPFGSVLSVNYDPGRPWKYLGSLLLVIGSIWHFVIRGRKAKTKVGP